ncbi:hypothetical protein EST38_g4788 [Candolleomyces aberdarensis]|uniref:Nephrocystin 3-like N-terminal domain-containing protein n=1 Tax=Candolleomyces aberdarensis TaxID=2316362 RepID=A0A4Q2DLS6_9AGAR|nr:hypothetical protein EST38_g4788 [Candolleomyces aberdarensis]
MSPKIDVLSEARNVTIQGSQFNSTQIVGQSLVIDPALEILHKYRALEATHTSKTAASAPKCKPGTRARAVEDIMRWATDLGVVSTSTPGPDSEKSVMWFQGPAGAGKTCIMTEVARLYSREGVLAGVYFFSTRVQGLDDDAPFVATIVSQLITDIPALSSSVLESIRSNPTIFEQSLDLQLEKLILDQFASIPPPQSTAPKILISTSVEFRNSANIFSSSSTASSPPLFPSKSLLPVGRNSTCEPRFPETRSNSPQKSCILKNTTRIGISITYSPTNF